VGAPLSLELPRSGPRGDLLQSACTTGAPRAGLLVGHRYKSLVPPPAPRVHVTLTPRGDFAPVQVSDTALREVFTQLVLEVSLRVAARSAKSQEGHPVRASWLGVESRTLPRWFSTLFGDVRLVTVKALLPSELEYVVRDAPEGGPAELARRFAEKGDEHLSRASRLTVV
jgi:hypothetical protein